MEKTIFVKMHFYKPNSFYAQVQVWEVYVEITYNSVFNRTS